MRLVTEVRRFRSDQGLRPTQPVPAVLAGIEATPLAAHEARIRALLRLTAAGPDFTPTASVQAEGVTVRLDTAATIDVAAERRRLEKDLAAAQADVDAAETKLSTPSFIERAPAAVVAKNRDRLAAAQAEITRIAERLAALPPAKPLTPACRTRPPHGPGHRARRSLPGRSACQNAAPPRGQPPAQAHHSKHMLDIGGSAFLLFQACPWNLMGRLSRQRGRPGSAGA